MERPQAKLLESEEYIYENSLENQNGGEHRFFVSDKPDCFKEQASVLLEKDIDMRKVEKVEIGNL